MDEKSDDPIVIRLLGRPGDLGWMIQAHGELYAREFSWDGSFEALVARIVADFAQDHDPRREAAWIAPEITPRITAPGRPPGPVRRRRRPP